MLTSPNSKINLGLSVTSKRSDGFHEVETIMYPIPLRDILEVIPSPDGKFSYTASGLDISGDRKSNLVVRAYALMKNSFNIPQVHIHLHKIIPMGAGLGGGSADAAYCLVMLNDMFKLNLNVAELQKFASKLGSDCPFFITNRAMLATGTGTTLSNVEVSLKGFHLVLVKPDIHINTAEAYSMIAPKLKDKPLASIINLPVNLWNENLINDFEKPVFDKFQEIKKIKEKLLDMGAVYAALTGSGAAVYGLFDAPQKIPVDLQKHFVWSSELKV